MQKTVEKCNEKCNEMYDMDMFKKWTYINKKKFNNKNFNIWKKNKKNNTFRDIKIFVKLRKTNKINAYKFLIKNNIKDLEKLLITTRYCVTFQDPIFVIEYRQNEYSFDVYTKLLLLLEENNFDIYKSATKYLEFIRKLKK